MTESPTDLRQIKIHFEGLSIADANVASKELAQILTPQTGENGSVTIERTDASRQDMGATLVLVLGTPAAYAIAKGVRDYIAKRGSRIIIETPEGKVIASGDAATNIDVAKTAAAIRNR